MGKARSNTIRYLGVLIWILAFVLAIGLSVYSFARPLKDQDSVSFFLKNPDYYDGIIAENSGPIEDIQEFSFVMVKGKNKILVKHDGTIGEVRKPILGTMDLVGIYHKEGYIEATDFRYDDYNFVKYILSAISFIIFTIYFFKEWKLTWKGFEIRGAKDNA